jgi:hypothetical protein
MTDTEVVEKLREIVNISQELAALGGDYLGLRNRAIEIAANAEIMLWTVSPDDSDWLDPIYSAGTPESEPDQ